MHNVRHIKTFNHDLPYSGCIILRYLNFRRQNDSSRNLAFDSSLNDRLVFVDLAGHRFYP